MLLPDANFVFAGQTGIGHIDLFIQSTNISLVYNFTVYLD